MKIEMKGIVVYLFCVFDDEALAVLYYSFIFFMVSILNNHQLSMECSLGNIDLNLQ